MKFSNLIKIICSFLLLLSFQLKAQNTIGYTLGHEMSHSLDDTGSKYDYKGNLHNWWTPDDRRKFEAKVRDVVKQYETFALYDGIKMDATLFIVFIFYGLNELI
jgi:predicted metalloendopeptidase